MTSASVNTITLQTPLIDLTEEEPGTPQTTKRKIAETHLIAPENTSKVTKIGTNATTLVLWNVLKDSKYADKSKLFAQFAEHKAWIEVSWDFFFAKETLLSAVVSALGSHFNLKATTPNEYAGYPKVVEFFSLLYSITREEAVQLLTKPRSGRKANKEIFKSFNNPKK